MEQGGELLTWISFLPLSRNLANTASLLWHAYKSLPQPSKDVNWAGMFNAHLPAAFPATSGAFAMTEADLKAPDQWPGMELEHA